MSITRRLLLKSCALLALAACTPGAELRDLHGADLTAMARGVDFYLHDTEGRPRQLRDFRGKALILFFGFTHCPEICPTTLARAIEIEKLLGPQADDVQIAFVTLDPQRDLPAVLKRYVQAFDARFIGLTGSEGEVKVAADNLHVVYKKVPIGDSYTIDHSARSYVFDRQGRLSVGLAHEQTAAACTQDIRQVLALR